MFAVIKTGGKQYRVAANDEFEIERLPGAAGDAFTFQEVLMVGTAIGAPFVAGASVTAEIVEQKRGPKVISFKKRRRQNSKRTRGHRQDLTLIRIGEILTDGQAPTPRTAETTSAVDDATSTVAGDDARDDVATAAPGEAGEMTAVGGETVAKRSRAPRKPKAAEDVAGLEG